MTCRRPRVLAFAVLAVLAAPAAADWKPAPTPLMTRWGKEVTADRPPWPEYPRPQLVRRDWLNLNGLWDYAITPKGAGKPETWDGRILVPFCAESALSGVGKRVSAEQALWYRRPVEVPAGWAGRRVLLHFGAVDWEATVFVNGKQLLTHRGGFDPFSVDVTDALDGGKGELVVRVWDPTDAGSQPRGKQVNKPEGIWYTPVTGIWQTAWLEPAAETAVQSVRTEYDLAGKKLTVRADVRNLKPGDTVGVQFRSQKGVMFGADLGPDGKVELAVPDPVLWSPDAPHLYDGLVAVFRNGQTLDQAEIYTALRTISTGKDENGHLRLLLNNRPLFQVGPLDQGWWPDGLLTPPSDAAMRYDLEMTKRFGFNMLRKHIKVEPARLYRHCDELGLLVWQDMPSGMARGRRQFVQPDWKADGEFAADEKAQFRAELKAMIDHLRPFPCIYCWVPFNEGWGQHDTNDVLRWVKGYDPTRLVNGPSGWTDRGYGDMKDRHDYPGPGMFAVMPDRVSVLGEFGGLGLPVKGHLWKDQGNWGYRTYKTGDELRDNYRQLVRRLHPLVGKGLAAAVYTQTTDVEVEVNGLLTYDRAVTKLDPEEVAGWHRELFGPPPVGRELVATSEKSPQPWRYATEKPADGWQRPDFDDATWAEGKGGFGTAGTPGAAVGTEWKTPAVWARRPFELAAAPAGEVALRLHHDEDAEVYVNGVLAAKLTGYTTEYVEVPVTAAARAALKPGRNVLAVRCRQTGGGQYIDAGLVEYLSAKGR